MAQPCLSLEIITNENTTKLITQPNVDTMSPDPVLVCFNNSGDHILRSLYTLLAPVMVKLCILCYNECKLNLISSLFLTWVR